jgi:serine/threonine-protein kinase RsbW
MAMSQGDTYLLDLQIPHRIERLPGLLDAIEGLAAQHEWDAMFCSQILLVVEELVVNAVSYGGRDPDEGWVLVRVAHAPDGLFITIVDNGQPYDPFASAPEPDLDLDLDSRSIGGLGVHFVREMTDIQTYVRSDGKNRVTLLKRWPQAD